ncbi:hypothetical protein [Mesorhizobium sp.]|uniref:DUF7940 domain-containing protein n=1 Tax=Mesorhizobium sp. TaxID=1871066 RepID=UPI000FEAB037|nr:hypothetical protein [Mesorhizobium sp.]RWO20647.1 MAG: hypothetical protein EOS09_26370 [Mesorhizobium sp.]
MKLIPDWKAVLRHAYSVHFVAISIFFGVLDVIANFWYLFDGLLPISRGWFASLGVTFGILGLVGRFIPQKPISGDVNADK